MKKIEISSNIGKLLKTSRLGIITSNVKVQASSTKFKNFIASKHEKLIKLLETTPEKTMPVIQETRHAYKVCGKEPSRYRPSAEALLKRLRTKKELYEINNVVDAINLMSVYSQYSIGGFDLDKIHGNIALDIGDSNEYNAIGRGQLNIEFMPGVRDELGFFGTPTSDSERTMVTENTEKLILVFYDFYGNSKLVESLDFAEKILSTHCNGTKIQSGIVNF